MWTKYLDAIFIWHELLDEINPTEQSVYDGRESGRCWICVDSRMLNEHGNGLD